MAFLALIEGVEPNLDFSFGGGGIWKTGDFLPTTLGHVTSIYQEPSSLRRETNFGGFMALYVVG